MAGGNRGGKKTTGPLEWAKTDSVRHLLPTRVAQVGEIQHGGQNGLVGALSVAAGCKVPVNGSFAVTPVYVVVRMTGISGESPDHLAGSAINDLLSGPLGQTGDEPVFVFLVREHHGGQGSED